ncbi:hypothetical protein [uncultured Bradyrhizobium sp.]|uniref:hypothetical protein n=1 Tax=uncultured Bradyrhizobium sp. TaxID=199684 RepID=UPI0035CB645F
MTFMEPNSGASGPGLSSSKRRIFLRRDVAICVLLGLASFLIYNANLRAITAVDTYAARYLPFSIWRHHAVVLDPIANWVAQGRTISASAGGADRAWWVQAGRGNHLVSFYPIVVPVVMAPLYLPAIAYLAARNWDPLLQDYLARIMEKLCASLLATASVILLYLLMRRRTGPGTAALLALTFAFGTTTWVISSQALWMHGLAQLMIVAMLLVLTGPRSSMRVVSAGLLCALIACNRPPDAILAAGLAFYALWWAGRMIPPFVAAAALPLSLVLIYNLGWVGHIVGGYGLVSRARISEFINDNALIGLAGLLVSPTRGLFVFSPFLLFIPFCFTFVLRDRNWRALTLATGSAAALQMVFYGFGDWRQGMSFGPRWLTDALPILFWMLPPVVGALSTVGRFAFGLACVVAIAIQATGAFWYTGVSDANLFAAIGSGKMRAAWDIRNASFIAELNHSRPPADLLDYLQGHIDLITVSNKEGGEVEVQGWALTNGQSPIEVAVRLDGRIVGSFGGFFERPDVVSALGKKSPSGWRIKFPAGHLALGEHVVAAIVRAHDGSEARLLQERTFILPAAAETDHRDQELTKAAEQAAGIIVERQQAPGFWLTAFTDAERFERPRQEMNTFINAMMLDIAGPVAQPAGIENALNRARVFLASQIEDGGLVRYHGRPDASTIGTLGCAITPDADDTALVWRISPGSTPQLRSMALETLSRFRTADGLYRTWLAPRDRYACIDPGSDPNPADIAIQMHVLMFLAEANPPAARALCEALQRRGADESIWVYYKLVPLVAILRLPELNKLGCPMQLPETMLRTTIPGQQIWVEALQRLQSISNASGEMLSGTSDFLHKLAAEDFSTIAHHPPLLYHNDLTASVRRFYWSEELGYAVWLRLYFEHQRRQRRSACGGSDAQKECTEK